MQLHSTPSTQQWYTHWFPLVCASATQMARVIVITVDNGCGSPLTSGTTGSARAQTHSQKYNADIPRTGFYQLVETRQDFNSWTGRGTTTRGVICTCGGAMIHVTDVNKRARTHTHTQTEFLLPPSLAISHSIFVLSAPIIFDFQQGILHNQPLTVLYETPAKLYPCSALIPHVEDLD